MRNYKIANSCSKFQHDFKAVIDQNLDVVQYLVENNADIDAQDNEGWTPLMAGVSCDFGDIVRYLLDKGADPSAVNSDGELPLDLTDSPEMRSLLQQEITRRGKFYFHYLI